ncbi:OLC1v1007270C3 [Oldenlandia corymbosa var. corymbosa]|uniref:OLC1v1007270C3 n=1 Tax=Oldenlandia corymbosa var. corymbosa TaxID=529605 RepID=A0AAV1DIY3_OLDCO|nr:OLC1v1007270C3 [Oldenlandia corymbosa var. corymbosa]
METLVVVAHHRNQYYSRSRNSGPVRYGSFESPPSKGFRGINCRTFQSGSGILPTPSFNSLTSPVAKKAVSRSPFQKSPSPPPYSSVGSHSEEPKKSKRPVRSSPIPIPFKLKVGVGSRKSASLNSGFDLSFAERWAGPAYSNSPPPSSLPIPKFSVARPKRTVSLDLPSTASDIDFRPIAKSAPVSPRRERSPSPSDMFDDGIDGVDSATKTLRRILNLDLTDE